MTMAYMLVYHGMEESNQRGPVPLYAGPGRS